MRSRLDYSLFLYKDESLLEITEEAYQELLANGSTRHGWANPGGLPDLILVYPQREEFCTWDLTGADTTTGLNFLLDHGRLATPETEAPHDLRLLHAESLREVLAQSLPADISQEDRENAVEFLVSVLDRGLKQVHKPVHDQVRETGRYFGTMAYCPRCGEPTCSTSSGWVENHTPLLVAQTDAANLYVRALLVGV